MQDKRDIVVGASQNISSSISQLQLLAQFPAISGPIFENDILLAEAGAAFVIAATDKLKDYADDVIIFLEVEKIKLLLFNSLEISRLPW